MSDFSYLRRLSSEMSTAESPKTVSEHFAWEHSGLCQISKVVVASSGKIRNIFSMGEMIVLSRSV